MNEKSFHRAFHLRVFGERNMLLKASPETSGVFQKTSDEIKKTSDEFLKTSRRVSNTFLLLFRLFSGVFTFYSRMILSINKQNDTDRNAIIYKVTGKYK